MDVVVGRLGRAHGIRGEVSVEVRSDEPDVWFADGAVLRVRAGDGATAKQLTVRSSRMHTSRLLVSFTEVGTRTEAEAMRGAELVAAVDADSAPRDPDEFYDRQLVGLRVSTTAGDPVGVVTEVQHLPAQDLLVVRGADRTHLVPFVQALVPDVDLVAGTVRVEAPPGLLDDPDLRA
ncbi:ribosome maturation factor RimM [soil metagenome]